ncbi:hypothetical protein BASA62_001377 [Batrachochytrium salamandrivorans]|nr:hypothetical protein BASA62_001377 [Batrachochytrium salamandrivorans]
MTRPIAHHSKILVQVVMGSRNASTTSGPDKPGVSDVSSNDRITQNEGLHTSSHASSQAIQAAASEDNCTRAYPRASNTNDECHIAYLDSSTKMSVTDEGLSKSKVGSLENSLTFSSKGQATAVCRSSTSSRNEHDQIGDHSAHRSDVLGASYHSIRSHNGTCTAIGPGRKSVGQETTKGAALLDDGSANRHSVVAAGAIIGEMAGISLVTNRVSVQSISQPQNIKIQSPSPCLPNPQCKPLSTVTSHKAMDNQGLYHVPESNRLTNRLVNRNNRDIIASVGSYNPYPLIWETKSQAHLKRPIKDMWGKAPGRFVKVDSTLPPGMYDVKPHLVSKITAATSSFKYIGDRFNIRPTESNIAPGQYNIERQKVKHGFTPWIKKIHDELSRTMEPPIPTSWGTSSKLLTDLSTKCAHPKSFDKAKKRLDRSSKPSGITPVENTFKAVAIKPAHPFSIEYLAKLPIPINELAACTLASSAPTSLAPSHSVSSSKKTKPALS